MKASFAWRGIATFALFPSRPKYAAFFDWIGGGYRDPLADTWTEHMLDVVEFGAAIMEKLPRIVVYEAEDLAAVTVPVLVLCAGKPILYDDPFEFAAAAQKALPQAEATVVPEAGHGLNMEEANYVNERMIAFLSENFPTSN
jgi:pimeloyl-ACP methyl ester carboxylesterase